jgi:hypothetical protein
MEGVFGRESRSLSREGGRNVLGRSAEGEFERIHRKRKGDRNVRGGLDEMDEAKAFVAEKSNPGRKNMPNENRVESLKRVSCREARNAPSLRGKPRRAR